MTPTEWVLEKGLPLVVNSILIPVGMYLVRSARDLLKEFRAVGDSVKEHSLELGTLKAALERTKEDLAHLRGNVDDLGRYLKSRANFRGFRAELRKDEPDEQPNESQFRGDEGTRETTPEEGLNKPLRSGREEGGPSGP